MNENVFHFFPRYDYEDFLQTVRKRVQKKIFRSNKSFDCIQSLTEVNKIE